MPLIFVVCLFINPLALLPSSLEETLDQIGKSVENSKEDFGSVACTEYVSQFELGKTKTVIYKREHEFDYMIFAKISGNEMRVEESRQKKKTKGREKDLPLLLTEGFPTLLLIFNPYYQGSFEYQYSGEETFEGQHLITIDFRYIRGEKSTSVLHLRGKNYPLELAGTAWIDPKSHNIRRIKADLIKSLEAVGLHVFSSDVLHMPI